MTYLPQRDFDLETGLGNESGYTKVNKFGQAPEANSGVPTDVWDGATAIWVAPTSAQQHVVVSTSGLDNGVTSQTGMRTVRVYGLTAWNTAETSEDVTLNGNGSVMTSNSYVIVHRMKGLTFGSGGTNAGVVSATAQSDGTVTAQINVGEGQTLMAIYGVPSTQTIHLKRMVTTVLKNAVNVVSDGVLLVMENAGVSTAGWITKERWQFSRDNSYPRDFYPPKNFAGPCIVKVQANTSANDSVVTAAFDAYVVDN